LILITDHFFISFYRKSGIFGKTKLEIFFHPKIIPL